MRRRALLLVVAAMLALTACGDDDDASLDDEDAVTTTVDPSVSTTALADLPAPSTATDALELELVSTSPVTAGPHTWSIELRNASDAAVAVTFPTSQRADVVLADGSEVVHRWSTDRFFQQQVSELSLEPGATETIELEDDLSTVEPGFYEVRISAAVVGAPEPVTDSVRIVSP